MGALGGPSAGPPADHNCRTAYALMQKGLYEQAADLLLTMRTDSAQANTLAGDTLYAYLLEAARSLCLTCQRHRAEAQWHQQAHQDADRQEQEVKLQLAALFEQIDSTTGRSVLPGRKALVALSSPSPTRETRPPQPSRREKRSLWQRIQAILGQRPPAWLHESEPTKPPFAAVVQPSSASADTLPALPPAPSLAIDSASSANEREVEADPSLVVYCLGTFRVYQGDRLITDWNGQKGKSIFKYLLAHRETPVAKDILMDLFWPGVDPESARRSLHQAIYSLRQALRRGNPDFSHVYFENDCYLLNPDMALWVDRIEFEKHLQAGRRLEAANQVTEAIEEYGIAESLYQGDYLEEDLYEDWPAIEREHLRRTYCELADRLSEHYVRNGEHNAAIALCQKILERDNCHEPAYRRLMRCYLAQGQRHLAVRQYQTCVELLQVELEIGPSEETETLYQEIADAR